MSTILSEIINNPAYHEYLAILKGARNGFVYGVKVRLPHALVMTVLFGRGDLKSRAGHIFRATKFHALNLAKFVTIYKTLLLLQRKANAGKERIADSFIAGLVGGYIVFGERNAINEQIVLYVASRVMAAIIPRAPGVARTGKPIPPDSRYFSVCAALAWGGALWLFNHRGEHVQGGMFNSMTYLYKDSERWKDLRTLLWHNV